MLPKDPPIGVHKTGHPGHRGWTHEDYFLASCAAAWLMSEIKAWQKRRRGSAEGALARPLPPPPSQPPPFGLPVPPSQLPPIGLPPPASQLPPFGLPPPASQRQPQSFGLPPPASQLPVASLPQSVQRAVLELERQLQGQIRAEDFNWRVVQRLRVSLGSFCLLLPLFTGARWPGSSELGGSLVLTARIWECLLKALPLSLEKLIRGRMMHSAADH